MFSKNEISLILLNAKINLDILFIFISLVIVIFSVKLEDKSIIFNLNNWTLPSKYISVILFLLNKFFSF